MDKFTEELEQVINKHSLENGSDTPDFILAEYLTACLKTFNETLVLREKWWGRTIENAVIENNVNHFELDEN